MKLSFKIQRSALYKDSYFVLFRVLSWIVLLDKRSHAIHEITQNLTKEHEPTISPRWGEGLPRP